MEFHPDKCKVLTITRKKNPIKSTYTLHGIVLERVSSTKYLGLTLTNQFDWNVHIDNISNKANKSICLLKRNVRMKDVQLKYVAYSSLVRPHLEYAVPVWDPYTKKNIDKLEIIQRRAARYVLDRYHYSASVTEMLNELGWKSLEKRRKYMRLIMMYKIANSLVAINVTNYLKPCLRQNRNYNDFAFILPRTGPDYFNYSFFPRTIKDWNVLPNHVVKALTMDPFKTLLSTV